MPHEPLYFDDIQVGETWTSGARTITETDIVLFAGLTGDYNPLHVDEEFAKRTFYGHEGKGNSLDQAAAPSPEAEPPPEEAPPPPQIGRAHV